MPSPAAGSAAARPRLVAILATIVALAAVALIVVGVTTLPDAGAAGSTGPAAAAAGATTALNQGSQIAVDFTSFNYKTLAQDQAQIATHLTPTFRKTYLAQSRPLNSVI